MTATRILHRPAGRVVAVRRARLRVARGPSRGEQLELSSLQPIVIGCAPEADLVLADDEKYQASPRPGSARANASQEGQVRSLTRGQ